jgi:hypothetical protein
MDKEAEAADLKLTDSPIYQGSGGSVVGPRRVFVTRIDDKAGLW